MALTKNFTDDCGVDHFPAHWRTTQINISTTTGTINLTFLAYKDLNSFNQKKSPLAGGIKTYSISGEEFLGIAMAKPVGDNLYDTLANAAETYALSKLDTKTGQLDGDGKPIMVSFFNGATKS